MATHHSGTAVRPDTPDLFEDAMDEAADAVTPEETRVDSVMDLYHTASDSDDELLLDLVRKHSDLVPARERVLPGLRSRTMPSPRPPLHEVDQQPGPSTSNSSVVTLSPSSSHTIPPKQARVSDSHLAVDERMARDLQEEYDREAASVVEANRVRLEEETRAARDWYHNQVLLDDDRGLYPARRDENNADTPSTSRGPQPRQALRTTRTRASTTSTSSSSSNRNRTAGQSYVRRSRPNRLPTGSRGGERGELWQIAYQSALMPGLVSSSSDDDDYEHLLELERRMGSAAMLTIPKQQCEEYPVVKPPSTGVEGEDSCQICMCEYETTDDLRLLPCFHRFHVECIDRWITTQRATCPVCRVDLRHIEDSANDLLNESQR